MLNPKRKCENNNEMGFEDIGRGGGAHIYIYILLPVRKGRAC
jgi:hypothetical protein